MIAATVVYLLGCRENGGAAGVGGEAVGGGAGGTRYRVQADKIIDDWQPPPRIRITIAQKMHSQCESSTEKRF